MKLNNKIILSLLMIFIAVISVSCVSAADNSTVDTTVADNNAVSVSYDGDINYDGIITADSVEHTIPNQANATFIQDKINEAKSGDTISFAENGNYTFDEKDIINVDKEIHFIGNNATFNIRNGFLVQASQTTSIDGTSFEGFNFVIPSTQVGTNQPWNGRAIEIRGGSNLTVNDCVFTNGNAGIYIRGSNGNITISNSYFTGMTNATTIGTNGETGTKAINLMGGNGVIVKNNTFKGNLLDAVSIASNSRNIIVDNNNIIDAWYGIFYGGGLENITTQNNIFNNTRVYAIGLVKAAQSSYIYNNTFIIGDVPEKMDSNAAIYIEQGNTCHGAATRIGNLHIVNNTFEIAKDTEGSDKSRYAVEIFSAGGQLKPNGPIEIQNNTYTPEIGKFVFIDANWNYKDGNLSIPVYNMDTEIVPAENNSTLYIGDLLNIQLRGRDGTILPNQKVVLTFSQNGKQVSNATLTTDKFGIASYINTLNAGAYNVTATFAGATFNGGVYNATTAKFAVNSKYYTPIISGNNMTLITGEGNRFTVVLKDSDNRLLANKNVTISINGMNYTKTTDENGVAGLNINLNMGKYNITASYKDENGNIVNNTYVLTTLQGESKFISNITNITKKGQQFKVQLVNSAGTPLKDQAVAFHINGVPYYKVTDENGFAYLNINLPTGKIYNMFMSYGGTLLYKGCTGGSQVNVKY